jgi:hypothetical protein
MLELERMARKPQYGFERCKAVTINTLSDTYFDANNPEVIAMWKSIDRPMRSKSTIGWSATITTSLLCLTDQLSGMRAWVIRSIEVMCHGITIKPMTARNSYLMRPSCGKSYKRMRTVV